MKTMLTAAKAAKFSVTALTTEQKNAALEAMAQALIDNQDTILAANAMDIENATGKVPQVMLDRLLLTADRIAGMAKGIREVAALPDPVGHLLERHTRADGLQIDKVSVPMGVIAIIYESRPNVTSDAAALARSVFSSSISLASSIRRSLIFSPSLASFSILSFLLPTLLSFSFINAEAAFNFSSADISEALGKDGAPFSASIILSVCSAIADTSFQKISGLTVFSFLRNNLSENLICHVSELYR